jgi:predicted metalloprotease with PDZ domain
MAASAAKQGVSMTSHRVPAVLSLLLLLVGAGATAAPSSAGPLPAPRDVPYPGEVRLEVDARDVPRRIIHVHETITGLGAHPVLLYPKWIPGTHAPQGPIDRVAGIRFSVNGHEVAWMRDPVEVFAFRPTMPAGAHTLEVSFDYLSPTSDRVGKPEITDSILMLEWSNVVLYPAGYYARRIPVSASLTVPAGWARATALESEAEEGERVRYHSVPLETLIDSPVYAGRHVRTIELDQATHVRLDVFADRADELEAGADSIAAHRALVQQAYKLYRSHHYRHYDFLLSVSDIIPFAGLEHHESSADATIDDYFIDWKETPNERDLLPHEFTHSWNGKFRRPADLWTPNYEVPMQDSLLWVYEGQTQYWGMVLAARSGMWTRAQALDQWADLADYFSTLPGRRWRPLADTTNDEILNPRRPQSWTDWQRFEDYYAEGALIWLDADTLIRERSGGKRSLDDFAGSFFGVKDGSTVPLTYTFDDLVAALNAVEPYDWATFLHERVTALAPKAPLDGLKRAGYRLVYNDQPNEQIKAEEREAKVLTLRDSIGIVISAADDDAGTILHVGWDSAAAKAGLTEGMKVIAVNGEEYSTELLKRSITVAAHDNTPIELILKLENRYHAAHLDYHDGLRYPHLVHEGDAPSSLDAILTPKP